MYGEWKKEPDNLEGEGQDPMGKAYRWLWSRIGGRPWTFIIRDVWHMYPLWIILAAVNVLLFVGSLLGHLFWQ